METSISQAWQRSRSPVKPGQVESFRRNGWVVVRGLIPSEIATGLRQRLCEMAGPDHYKPRRKVRAGGGRGDDEFLRQVRTLADPAATDSDIARIARSPRVVSLASALVGTDPVRYIRTNGFEKPPQAEGSLPTALHQDFPYYPFDRAGSIQIWIALQDTPAKMGTLRFVSGSHRRYGPLGRSNLGALEEERLRRRLGPHRLSPRLHLAPGDATIHHDLTVHCAEANVTDTARWAMTVTFSPDDVRYTGAPYWLTDDLDLEVEGLLDHDRFPLCSAF